MSVQIDRYRITLFGDSLRYDPYYLDLAAEEFKTDTAAILKGLMQQWAEALMNGAFEGKPIYLPYSLDDEWVECLEAQVEGERVVTKCVHVGVNGYAVDLFNLSQFATSVHKIDKEYPETFGVYRRSELVSALRNAKIDLT